MAHGTYNAALSRNPRLYKIREMRSELRKLEAALARLEVQFQSGRPVGRLDLRLVHGWVLSIVESYVVLAYTSMAKSVAEISIMRLTDLVRGHPEEILAGSRDDQ